MKKKYYRTTNIVSALSLVNVVLVAAAWKKFLQLKTPQQIGVGLAVYFASTISGMYSVRQEAEALTGNLIEKYKTHIDEIKFDFPDQAAAKTTESKKPDAKKPE